jgi:hypothetical protein
MSSSIDKLVDRRKTAEKKVEQFADLLSTIESAEDKKKMLWKEIYENAVTDRENASMLFTDAYTQMQSGTAEHISLGSTMSKYLERMNKSNDQILKLAELISREAEKSARIDPDDLFSQIDGGA